MAWQTLDTPLSNNDSINAIAEAEAGLLQCISNLFYQYDNAPALTFRAAEGSLVYNIARVDDIDIESGLIKDVLCSLACKEFAIADILNSLSCRIALEGGSIKEDCDCNCTKR